MPTRMSSIHAITYASTAARAMRTQDLERLLLDARRFNEEVGVTGVLLFNGGGYFQYFEGPADASVAVYDRIRASDLHHSIVELSRTTHANRQFVNWTMGFSESTDSQWQQLRKADWQSTTGSVRQPAAGASEGLRLLHAFWQSSIGDA